MFSIVLSAPWHTEWKHKQKWWHTQNFKNTVLFDRFGELFLSELSTLLTAVRNRRFIKRLNVRVGGVGTRQTSSHHETCVFAVGQPWPLYVVLLVTSGNGKNTSLSLRQICCCAVEEVTRRFLSKHNTTLLTVLTFENGLDFRTFGTFDVLTPKKKTIKFTLTWL